MPRNVLFIMCDQLRWDYLGCTGHPHIRTPHIDALAARGVLFDRTYVQSPICGPSRMSTYTGRYVRSHGASWNNTPLRLGEWTLGDHLSEIGARAVLCGKTHVTADIAGLKRFGIDPASARGRHIAEGGFEVWDRLDGLHPAQGQQPSHYQEYLKARGYSGSNPWHDWANSAQGEGGEVLSGWLMENAHRPARIAEPDSETPYSTSRAMEFIAQAGDQPWSLHLSYIKPHWPYIVPPPYHDMYRPGDVLPAVGVQDEVGGGHPILRAYRGHRFSRVFEDSDLRSKVVAAYMGLISQIDDQIGRLMAWLAQTGRDTDTLIVFTSDHGDYLGDHGLGEKELFHDASARVPLIVVDPDAAADATRGTVDHRLVEAIDLVPTFVEWMGGTPRAEVLEGRSLVPVLHGRDVPWRGVCFSECDYSWRKARQDLGVRVRDARLVMAFDGRWKYIHCPGFAPMLFDLEADPGEIVDRGGDPGCAEVCARLRGAILDWALAHHSRTTISDADIARRSGSEHARGIWIGFRDAAEQQEALAEGASGN